MNAANESPPAPSLRRLPFSIRFAPEFTNYLSAILPEDGDEFERFDGFLFGIVESDFAVVRMFRLFPSTPGTGTQNSFETLLTQSRKESQVAGLTLVGWFSARNSVQLQPEDIAFHERNFVKPNHIALLVKSEPESQVSLEVYCRTSDGVFSERTHRSGGIRISYSSPAVAPLVLPLETKSYPESLFTDQTSGKMLEEAEPAAAWKDVLASVTKRASDLLKTAQPEETGDSVTPSAGSEEVELIQLDDPSSITPNLQFGTPFGGYGAAVAPAKIPQDQPEIPRTVEPGTQDTSPKADTPHIVSVPKQRSAAPPPGEAVLVRSEGPRAAPSANEFLAKALHSSPHSVQSSTEPRDVPAAPQLTAAASLQPFSRFRTKTLRDLPWRGMAALFAVVAASTFVFIYLKTAHANGRLPAFLQAFLPPPALNLKVATVGERFQLSWNRETPAVRNAREAILDINDGSQHHQIQLGSAELASGSVLYLPNTDDIVFRLEVHGAGGQNANESLRVVGASKTSVFGVNDATGTAASGTGAFRTQTARKKAALPRGVSTGPLSERPRHEDVLAGNRVASNVRKSVPVSPVPHASPAPVSPPPAAKTEASDKPVVVAESAAPNPTVPPARDSASSLPANTGASASGAEQSHPLETSTPQASGGAVPALTPQRPEMPPEQAGRTGSKPLVSYRPPHPVKQVLPKLSTLPPGIAAEAGGEVRVVVKVDESGHVVDARLIEGRKKISSFLASASLTAARQWVFEPASLHGVSIPSDHTILFQFRHLR